MGPKSSSAKGKISLEDYLNFNAAHSYDQISVSYLNQIILMNGFKILKQPKMVIVDAVESMDFMDPSRSTLSENISPHAPISLEEAIKDLVLLN